MICVQPLSILNVFSPNWYNTRSTTLKRAKKAPAIMRFGVPVLTPSVRSIIRSHPEMSGWSNNECDRISAGISRRNRRLAWVVPAASWIAFMGTLIVLIEICERMDDRGVFDIHPWTAPFFELVVSLGVAAVALNLIRLALIRVLLPPIIERALDRKHCLWCGYCLTGLEVADRRVRCPECGNRSPIRV